MNIDIVMQEFEESLLEMGSKVRRAMVLAVNAFIENDKRKALQVIEMDEFINFADESINEQAIEALSLLQPVAKDLRTLIAGIKIATDFERIGDYAKNIARYVIKKDEEQDKFDTEISELMDLFLHNFDETLKVVQNKDVKRAYQVAELDDDLDLAFQTLIHKIADAKMNLYPVSLVTMLRNVERAGDHSKNICEQVIYINKGLHVDLG